MTFDMKLILLITSYDCRYEETLKEHFNPLSPGYDGPEKSLCSSCS